MEENHKGLWARLVQLNLRIAARLYKHHNKHLSPRPWSNNQLLRISPYIHGDVLNVSGWLDQDKQGRQYEDYFNNSSSYQITNYRGARSGETQKSDCSSTNLHLDISLPLPKDFRNQSFEAVFNHTTLEHIRNIDQAFCNLVKLTTDLLILVVPFHQCYHVEDGSYGDFFRFTPELVFTLCIENRIQPLIITTNSNYVYPTYIFLIASKQPTKWRALTSRLYPENILNISPIATSPLAEALATRPFLI